MITWILYTILLGAALALAADRVAWVLRARGLSERRVWTAALLGAVLLPLALPLMPRIGASAVGLVPLPGIAAGVSAAGTSSVTSGPTPDQWVLLLWGAAILAMAFQLWSSTLRLRRIVANSRLIRRWPVEIRTTGGTGPAVAGLGRPVVLIPASVGGLERAERRWILRHEFEHIRAGDPGLIWLALAARSLMPWNPATWFLGRRLRDGLEFDCDRRVLARRPDARSYGETLLALADPRPGPALPIAAFREPLVSLKRRFFAMTTPRRSLPPRTLAMIAPLAAAGWVAACEFSPTYVTGEPMQAEVPTGADSTVLTDVRRIAENPTFTPYTVAPDLINREEVISALEREYSPTLREAGIGGTTNVWFFIDAEGEVQDLRIQQSSGHSGLDEAAIRTAATIRFSPALNQGTPVPVWVAFPITFRLR
jgi:TonB family protein